MSGMILSAKLRNKSAAETVRALKRLIYGVPVTIRTNCGMNYTSNDFENFCKKLRIHHVESSPHYHQRNDAAQKSVDVIKQILRKDKKKTVEELCFNLNNISSARPKSSPMEMFFQRKVCGMLPNQFSRDCAIKEAIEQRVKKPFEIATHKVRFNRNQ